MVKKSEINKKGRLAKSTLSVVLAASMVLSSSSFVWAAPADMVIVEEGSEDSNTNVAAVAADIQAVDETENVGADANIRYTFPNASFLMKTSSFPRISADGTDEQADIFEALDGTVVARNLGDFEDKTTSMNILDYMEDPLYVVTITDEIGNLVADLTGMETRDLNNTTATGQRAAVEEKLPCDVGNYKLHIDGTGTILGTAVATGSTVATFSIVDSQGVADVTFKDNEANRIYNGTKWEPEIDKVTITVGNQVLELRTKDYEVIGYENNTDACLATDSDAAYVEIKFNGAYSARGTQKFKFAIQRAELDANVDGNAEVTVTNTPASYNSGIQKPVLKVIYNPGSGYDKIELKEGKDFKITVGKGENNSAFVAGNAKDIGTYSIQISAINNFKNPVDQAGDEIKSFRADAFTIKQGTFNSSTIEIKDLVVPYGTTGAAKPANGLVVINKDSKEPLTLDTKTVSGDYKILYAKNDAQGKVVYSEDPTDIPTTPGKHGIKIVSTGVNYMSGSVIGEYTVAQGNTLQNYILGSEIKFAFDEAATAFAGGAAEYDREGVVPSAIQIKGESGKTATFKAGTKVDGGSETDTWYTASFPAKKDSIGVGTYYVTLTGKSGTEFAGQTVQIPYTVGPKEVPDNLSVYVEGQALAGTAKKMLVLVAPQMSKTSSGALTTAYAIYDNAKVGRGYETATNTPLSGYRLAKGTDYDLTYVKETNGKYTVTVTYKGNYTGKRVYSDVEIGALNLNADNISASVTGEYLWTGKRIMPAAENIVLTEKNGSTNTPLRLGTDFTVVGYGANTDAGTGWIKIKGNNADGFYKGERYVEFEIKAGEDVKENYTLDTANLKAVYETGTNFNPAGDIAVKTKDGKTLATSEYSIKYYRDGKETADYKTTGNVTIEITVTANNTKLTASYRVATELAKAATIQQKFADAPYTGAEITPAVSVIKNGTTSELTQDKDYKVTYSSNKNIGTGVITIEGMGDYYGSYTRLFNIVAKDIKDAVVTVAEGTYVYNGSAQTPNVTVKLGDAVLSEADYDAAYTNNTNAGTATVTVTGKGNCTGTPAAATFVINKASQKLSAAKAMQDALKIRNTNANYYNLKVSGANTKLSYKSSNTKIASVSSAGKISFKHVCGKATITVTAAGDENYNSATLKVAVAVKPATPKITIASRAKGFNAKATAIKDITGYQVGYSTDKNFAASKTTKKLVKTTKALNKNFAGLSAKKGYYVRVRAYKKVGSTVYWGNWTSAKKVTTK